MGEILVLQNYKICYQCGGKCCKNMGCHYSPDDFGEITFDYLIEHINKGFTSIDWWEGDVVDGDRDVTYYLRMRNVGAPIVDPSWGGKCKLLTDKGCKLPYYKRPKGGRLLIPKENNESHCISRYTKEQSCVDWYKYQDILQKIVDFYNNL